MRLTGDRLRLSRDGRPSNPWRLVALGVLITMGVLLIWLHETGRVQPLFLPTYTPTRTALSYAEEGKTYFSAGDLRGAIEAYQNAVQIDPGDARLWAELARIQTYSSALLTTADQRRERLTEARAAADRAIEIDPEDSFAHAIRTLVYDWSASAEESIEGQSQREEFLNTAQTAAARALQLDPGNGLALAFYAEVQLDQQVFDQAILLATQAVAQADDQDPFSMDIHRVYATVLESDAQYRLAIEEYLRAAEIAPNFTYLYLLIGANYRQLRDIERALEYFERAARINEQIRVLDPTPYLAIGKTYSQQGEFFIAAINIEHALAIDPQNPDIYGRLGIVFFKARNYESAVVALQCAVDGCSAEVSQTLLCQYVFECGTGTDQGQQYGVEVTGLNLGDASLEYYYTYGSVLVYFRDTAEFPNACTDAERVFQQLLATYTEDSTVYGTVSGIVSENRLLCAGGGLPTTQTPGPTPNP
jgi:tetratricopeptide (TPR) repeat protein